MSNSIVPVTTTKSIDGVRQHTIFLTDSVGPFGMMELPRILGDVFIVPNLAWSRSTMTDVESWDRVRASVRSDWEKVGGCSDRYSRATHPENRLVQVWTTSEDSENWTDHGHAGIDGRFPDRIPSSWLQGLEEGDHLVVVTDKYMFGLTLRQSAYRYRSFGPFEKVLDRVNKDYVKS